MIITIRCHYVNFMKEPQQYAHAAYKYATKYSIVFLNFNQMRDRLRYA